jgi:hypothetical protein
MDEESKFKDCTFQPKINNKPPSTMIEPQWPALKTEENYEE